MTSKLKSIREEKGLSQEKAADLCRISPIMYRSMEQGKRKGSFRTWKKIQEGLDIPDEKMWDIIQDLAVR